MAELELEINIATILVGTIIMSVTIQDFLRTIFPEKDHFTCDNNWRYCPLKKLDPDEPMYFAICAVNDTSRKNENFKSLNVLVCDDVGTKAQIPSLSPSYIIESSPNNFQYGYILSEPEPSIDKAKTLINHLVKSGYSDPGAHGVVRLVRLPGGVNGKQDKDHKDFRVRLILWEPTTTYSYSELLSYFKKSSDSHDSTSHDYEIPTEIPDGQRNTEMTRLCGYLFGQGHSLEEVTALMVMYNNKLCKPPLEVSELQAIIKSIYTKHQSRYANIITNIYHIQETDTWFDFNNGSEMTASALNITYKKEFPGGQDNNPKLSNWLPLQSGFNQVSNKTWSPVPYHHQQRTILEGGRVFLNTWQGFAIEPSPGSVQPWLDLLAHVIPEPDYREALLWWIAFTIQRPDEKCNWQPVLLGISGAGKDALFQPVATILGSAYKSISNKDIKGDYDDGLYQTKLLHISEARGLSGNAIEFYKRITATESSNMQILNIKSKAKIMQRNLCNVLVITNNADAMKFDREERRAFVLRAPNKMPEEMKPIYFKDWLGNNGAARLFDYLLNYDLSKFDAGTRPYRTTHFDALLDITMSDSDIKLEELLSEFEAMLPALLVPHIAMDDRYNNVNKTIKAWLETNGWIRWDGNNNSKKIRGMLNGKQAIESRDWYVKKGSKFDGCKPAQIFDEAQRIRDIFAKKSKI